MKRSSFIRFISIALLAGCATTAQVAHAQVPAAGQDTKTVNWGFWDRNVPPGAPTVLVGSWDGRVWAKATCAHGGDATGFEMLGQGAWDPRTGPFTGPELKIGATAEHATSNFSTAKVTAGGMVPAVVRGQWPGGPHPGFTPKEINVTVDLKTNPVTAADNVGPPNPFAAGRARAHAKIQGAQAVGATLNGAVHKVGAGRNGKSGHTTTQTAGRAARGWDPIHITLMDDDTGSSWMEELLRFDTEASIFDPFSGWSFEPEGLTISAVPNTGGPLLSSVSLTGDASSSWLLNPYGAFSVSLTGGVFQSSGYWTGLWQLTTDGMGNVTSAFLAQDNLPFNLDYIIPSVLLNDTHTYSQAIEVTSEIEESEANVPEPAALLLLACGLALAAPRRRG